MKTTRKTLRGVLPVLTSHHLSCKTGGHVYSSCMRSVMLHASETWPLTKTNVKRLQRNDRAMIRQICSIKPEDVATVMWSKLLVKLDLEDLNLILREKRLRWFGLVECSTGAVRTACDIQIDGRKGAVRPKLTWKKLTEKDCSGDYVWDLLCVQLASYVQGGPLKWMMPLHMHVNNNLIMMMTLKSIVKVKYTLTQFMACNAFSSYIVWHSAFIFRTINFLMWRLQRRLPITTVTLNSKVNVKYFKNLS